MAKGVWFGGSSAWMKDLRYDVALATRSDTTVLITGERGVRKDLLAQMIHAGSRRRNAPFIAIDCHTTEFTSVDAGGGSLFLTGVARLSAAGQTQLMRLLDGRSRGHEASTMGSATARVIASSCHSLQEDVAANRFREDLFYRLNVVHLVVPPLRDRREDIPALVRQLFRLHAEAAGRHPPEVSHDALGRFVAYSWPGNLRELSDVVQRMLDRVPKQVIEPEHVPLDARELEPVAR